MYAQRSETEQSVCILGLGPHSLHSSLDLCVMGCGCQAGSQTPDGKTRHEEERAGPLPLPPWASLCGHCPPSRLARCLSDRFCSQGFESLGLLPPPLSCFSLFLSNRPFYFPAQF